MYSALFTLVVLGAAYCSFAFLAIAPKSPVFKMTNVRIFGCVFMTAWAMSCSAVLENPSPVGVLASGEKPEVVRIYASSVSAHMVNGQAVENVSLEKHIGSSVSLQLLSGGYGYVVHKNPVSGLDFLGTSPKPAIRASHRAFIDRGFSELDLINESLEQGSFVTHTWDKKQTDFSSVKWVRDDPTQKVGLKIELAFALSHFKADQSLPLC